MHKFLCVACLALAMQHLLKSCKNIENSYNNIPGIMFWQFIPVRKFCHRTVYWCSRVTNFPRNGNEIISENYIAMWVKIAQDCGLWPQKSEPVFDTHPLLTQISNQKLDEHPLLHFYMYTHPPPPPHLLLLLSSSKGAVEDVFTLRLRCLHFRLKIFGQVMNSRKLSRAFYFLATLATWIM